MMKTEEKKKLGAFWVIQCPLCGKILHSASEKELLPESGICACDQKENKLSVYDIYKENGRFMIRRNKYPRFSGEITFNADGASDIENVVFTDENCQLKEMASAMRKAGEYLLKVSNRRTKL